MSIHLFDLIAAFAQLPVLVIGDVMLDSYLEGVAVNLCREAPVPVVTVAKRNDAPGGAANTAANVQSLGGNVRLLSVVGADAEASLLRGVLGERNVASDHLIVHPERSTLAKHRIIAAAQMLVRYDQGSINPLDARSEAELIERLVTLFPASAAVIVSDYGYGILTPRVIATLAELQARYRPVLLVDSKQLEAYRHCGVTAVKPNYAEACRLLGLPSTLSLNQRIAAINASGGRLLELIGTRIAAITLDTDGALIFERGHPPYRTYAQPTSHSQAAGAGDTFVAALALALAAGATTPAAAELASAAASVVVRSNGTVTCTSAQLCASIISSDRAISNLQHLLPRIELYRQQGQRIVFTNGCFDILHRGHITLLNQAKALGDVLIVGVNSDASIRRIKGGDRPINSLEDRVQVLSALSCIDHIIAFDTDTPHELIAAIQPNLFVKGGNYTRENLPEADQVEQLGGRVHILPYQSGHSTSGLIARIRASALAEARERVRVMGAD